jgi:tetratricopeptide (TPR) repeat protein
MCTRHRTRLALLGLAASAALTLPAAGQDTAAARRLAEAIAEARETGCPRASGSLKGVPRRALPRDSLLVRIARIRVETKKNERTVAQLALEQQMKGLDAGKLAALGAMLWVQGYDNAAAHVLGASIEKEPRDFLTWNNLGAVLNRLDKSDQAIPLLRHAVALNAKSALPLHNLGIAFGQVGARDSATIYLDRAIALDGLSLEANLARGKLEKCAKKPQQALRFLKAARKAGGSIRVEDEVSETEEEIEEAEERAGRTETRMPDPPRPVPPQDLPKPGRYTPPPIPVDFDSATGLANNGTIRKLAEPLNEEANRLGVSASMVATLSPPTPTPEGPLYRLKLSSFKARTELARAHLYYQMVLDTALRHHQERVAQLHEQFRKKDDELLEYRVSHDDLRWKQFCSRWRALHTQYYGLVAAEARTTWRVAEGILEDWDVNSAYWVEQLREHPEREYRSLERRSLLTSRYAAVYVEVGTAGETEAADAMVCQGVPEPELLPPEPLSEFQAGDGECSEASKYSIDAVVLSMRIDCKEISFKGGEGLIGEFTYNYRAHSGTIYIGLGAGARIGAGGASAGLSADAGVYVTYDERAESVTDIGLRGTADIGISPNINAPSIGGEVRLGLNSAF